MAYEIKLDDPALPKGAVVTVDGLGALVNKGPATVVSNEQADEFRLHNQTQEFSHNDKGQLLVETHQGPTLIQAFKGSDVIKVREVKNAEPTDPVEIPIVAAVAVEDEKEGSE